MREYPAATLSWIVRRKNAVKTVLDGTSAMPMAFRKRGNESTAWMARIASAMAARVPGGGAPWDAKSASRRAGSEAPAGRAVAAKCLRNMSRR